MTQQISNSYTPRIAVTTGDPAGIGPEIVLRAAASPIIGGVCRLVLVGDARDIKRQAARLAINSEYPVLAGVEYLRSAAADIVIFDVNNLSNPVSPGVVSKTAGRAAIEYIECATRLALDGLVDAIATAPINKEAIKLAGSAFPGHTEMVASLCGSGKPLMTFFAGELAVALLTIHLSLADAIKQVTRENVISTVSLADSELKRFGSARPRIAVCGLNPHAGEHGLFGNEEQREMIPAIEYCRQKDIEVSGPFPADTLFVRAFRGEFDAVIACYHDQGLIPVKCAAFGQSAQATLGLPIIRTSVDHGTAFDIAGKGVADAGSMIEAIKLAGHLVEREKT